MAVLEPRTLPLLLDRARPVDRDRLVVRTRDGRQVSYGELDHLVARVAASVARQGVQQGDRVVVQLEKSVEAVVLHLALLRLGVVQVPLNPGYTKDETAAFVEDAEPALVISSPIEPGTSEIAEWPRVGPADPAAMLYTSGTTGRPKGAVLSQQNLASNANALVEAWGFTADDHLLHILPLFHTHGLFVALHCVLASGSSMTLLSRFDTEAVVSELPSTTVMMAVPTHYARLLESDDFTRPTTRNVRLFTSGSAPMSVPLHERIRQRTGHTVLERYGMTETSMLTSNPLDGERRPGTVGRPLPGVDVRIVGDGDALRKVGEVGDVQVRGPTVFGGYWHRPDLQSEIFTSDDWFRTGDLGRFDEGGYLALVGRSKDLIISGGMNVYPSEVEAVLDAQASVAESAVVGVPDNDFGEVVTAVVVPVAGGDLDEEAVRMACRERLAGFKVPKRFVVTQQLPRNAMGKVAKAQLRDELATPDEPPA